MKMTNEEFQRLVLQELGEIKNDVSKLEKGQQSIIKDVFTLKEVVSILKDGQKDIKALIEDLDYQNANRYVEIVSQINGLRDDINIIEIITSKNWNDIAKLKSVK